MCVCRKALESLANRDSGEGLRERARREMDALRETFNARIRELEEVYTHTHTHTCTRRNVSSTPVFLYNIIFKEMQDNSFQSLLLGCEPI